MMKKIWNCALTGHRKLPENLNDNALYDKLEELLENGCDTFFCGMAQGFDLRALKCLADLKRRRRFTIEACIPFAGHEKSFSAEKRKEYLELLEWCDQKTVLFENYFNGCFLVRDRYMVDCSDVVLAYCTKNTGGAFYTTNYALKKRVPVIYLQ